MKNIDLQESATNLPRTDAANACYHCHDPLPAAPLLLADKKFCCEGCKMVFEILNTNDLCDYYSLSEAPGVSQKNRKEARAWAFLDDPEVADKLLQYNDGETARTTLLLPQIHCASCLWLLEHLYRLDEGIQHSKVNFLKKEVTIQFNPTKTSLRRIAALLSGIGYAPEINLGDLEHAAAAVDKSIYYKIGIAGFVFGNIMLMSFPEYLGLEKEKDEWFFSIFGYLNLLLATPVLLYSAQDYFISAYHGLKNRNLNIDVPLALGAAVLYGRSAFEILTGTGAGYLDSFAGLIFFLLTGKWFQQKTFYHLSFERDYKSYFPVSATVKRAEGQEEVLAVNRLEPGDIILVRNQELIPADGILLRGNARIDYSFVTGEAEPQNRKSGDKIFAGGRQVGESIEVSLTRKVSQSYLTQLWNDEAFKSKTKSHASILADKAGRYFTTVILAVSTLSFLYWAPQSMATAINAFTAVLIIACPCAVALSIPFTLGNILRILGKNRFYLKNTQALEVFHTIDTVVFDKTGTITTAEKSSVENKKEGLEWTGAPLTLEEKTLVHSLVRNSSHPLSRRIAEGYKGLPSNAVTDFAETTGEGIYGKINGMEVWIGKRSFVPNGAAFAAEKEGTFVQIGPEVKGVFVVNSRYREGLAQVIAWFQAQYPVWLLSGDNAREQSMLTPIFGSAETMRFNQSPQDKLDFVKQMQAEGKKVLMVGDGLNDAGALQASNLGIVVSENTNNFTPACDAILDAREFERLPQFIELANEGVKLVGRAYFLAFCYNIVGLSYAVSGTLSPVVAAILMPLSSLTIILFGTLGSNWKAWKLGIPGF